MSSTSTPRTPPDLFSADNVKIVYNVHALDSLGDVPAVGELRRGIGGNEATNKEMLIEREAAALDPLVLAAAIASGPHISRHHYHHSFFPSAEDIEAHSWVWSDGQRVVSRQVPRNIRLSRRSESSSGEHSSRSSSLSPYLSPADYHSKDVLLSSLDISQTSSPASSDVPSSPTSIHSDLEGGVVSCPVVTHTTVNTGDVQVKCMVRTRVPTPHGEVFLHLYHNNRDNKEHLAIVIDPAQLDSTNGNQFGIPHIRSKSLDAVWYDGETEIERVTRGAYVGRLREASLTASTPSTPDFSHLNSSVPAPLVRIHSECFTGETIGSMRCDCGEQLDEALRRISKPITFKDASSGEQVTIPGRGAVIYMRQEGRGIGLLSKLRAYNLQDLGYDTVQANLMLGHGADERGYEVAAAIMHDLGLGTGDLQSGESVRLLTNNPDKVEKLRAAGVHVSEQISMIPRSWRCQAEGLENDKVDGTLALPSEESAVRLRSAGATLIGAGVAHGPELEKYLRTKVLKMGHMLSLPPF